MYKPDDYPEIIYKYRNWKEDNHKDILIKNILYMSPPIYFNDPFDCRIPTNYALIDSIEKIEKYVLAFIKKHQDFLLRKGINLEKEFIKMCEDFSQNIDIIQADHERILFDQQDKHYGVLSLSKRWNSILMWSHYADNHSGFCVGFSEDKIRESGLFGKGGPVHYNPENDYPTINPLEEENLMITGFKQTHTKAYDWEYEQEYRLTKLFVPNVPTTEDRKIQFKDDLLSEIIIGLTTSETSKKEILEIAKNKNIKVYQTKKVSMKFEIFREQIL